MKSSLHKQYDFAGGQSLLFTLFLLFKVQLFLMEILFAVEIMIQPPFQSAAHQHTYRKCIDLEGVKICL